MGGPRIISLDYGCTLFYDEACAGKTPSAAWLAALENLSGLLEGYNVSVSVERLLEAFREWRRAVPGYERPPWEESLFYKLHHVLAYLGVTPRPGLVDEAYSVLVETLVEKLQPYPDTRWFLEWCRERGLRIALISNTDSHDVVAGSLSLHRLIQFFDVVVTSDMTRHKKPSPRIFIDTALFLGAKPEEMIHIGDSYRWDYAGAAKAGAHPIQLARHHGCDAEPCFRDLVETARYLEELLG